MATLEKIRETIRELASRPRNVVLSEIEWVVDQLGANGYRVKVRDAGHQKLFTVESRVFGVCSHNPGSKQIKPAYAKGFIDAMIDLGLYDD